MNEAPETTSTSTLPFKSIEGEPAAPAGAQSPPELNRVRACFQLGWKVEAVAGLCQLGEGAASTPPSPFPPDFVSERVSEVQSLLQEIVGLVSVIGSDDGVSADGMTASPHDTLADVSHQMLQRAGTPPGIRALIPHVSELDAAATLLLVGLETDSLFETAYETGKALSRTYWTLRVRASSTGESSEIVQAWKDMFTADRVARIERNLRLLGSMFGDDNVRAVTSSVRYWRCALTRLQDVEPAHARVRFPPWARSRPEVTSAAVPGLVNQPDVLPALLDALRDQSENWYDLLAGRRPLHTFSPGDIMAALAEGVLSHTSWRLKHALPLLGGLIITIGVFGVMVALGVFVLYDHRLGPDASALTSLGTVITAAVTFVAGHVALLYQRGHRVARQVQLQAREVVSESDKRMQGVAQLVGQSGPETAHIASTILNTVIRQIEVEELAVALSSPLVKLVLRRTRHEGGNLLESAETFLRLIADERSNLARLVSVFPELYMSVAVVS